MTAAKPKLAVWKFASCDGCQLSILDLEDEILALAGVVEIAFFLEASSKTLDGPYDLSLVEGSITTPDDQKRIKEVRRQSKALITIGACATAGGIQALRNFGDVEEFKKAVYAQPHYIDTLAHSTPIEDHVQVDYQLRGCPVDKRQLLEVVSAHLRGRKPAIDAGAVCGECKRRGAACVVVTKNAACLGPVTHAGCGAICPAYGRACYGCFGPNDSASMPALSRMLRAQHRSPDEIARALRTFNAYAPEFRQESARHDPPND